MTGHIIFSEGGPAEQPWRHWDGPSALHACGAAVPSLLGWAGIRRTLGAQKKTRRTGPKRRTPFLRVYFNTPQEWFGNPKIPGGWPFCSKSLGFYAKKALCWKQFGFTRVVVSG